MSGFALESVRAVCTMCTMDSTIIDIAIGTLAVDGPLVWPGRSFWLL